jgi:hypothetical protein
MTAKRAGLIALFAGVLYMFFLGSIAETAITPAPDFPNYYYAARNLTHGSSVYADFADQMLAEFGVADINYFADPPSMAVLVYPLRYLSYAVGFWLLISVSTLGMVVTVWLTGSELGLRKPWLVALAAASLLTTGFRFLTFRNHIEVILALLAALGWIRLRRRGSPGAYWGVAAALKLFPALWTVAQIRNRKAVIAGTLSFLAVSGITVWVVGISDVATFVRDVVPLSRQWYEATGNYSLMSLGSVAGGVGLGWAFSVLGLIAFGWTIYRLGDHPDALYVSGVAWSLLLSPLSWLNYLVVVISPLMVAVPNVNWSARRQLYPGAVMLAGLVALRPVVTLNSYWLNVGLSRIPTLSLLLLAVWAPLLMIRSVGVET